MASMPEPIRGGSPEYAPGIQLTLSLKGQVVQKYNFDKPEITVGRDPYCDVFVDNPGVSRTHFKIVYAETSEFRVLDSGSSNGTYLNDRPVKIGTLRDGDTIQFAKYSLTIHIDQLVGGEESETRKVSVAEGATMMLSPAEVRQMVAEARGGAAAPKLNVVPARPAATRPTLEPSAEPKSAPPSWVMWVVLGGVAAAAAAIWMLTTR